MFIRYIFFIMIFTSILCAAPVDLTNLEGKIINATIISANETEVIVKRTSDAKQFTIEIASLDAESVKIIDIWRNNQKSLPTEEKSHNFSQGSHSFDLKFKLPNYKYGFSSLEYEVIYSFDVDGKINPAQIYIRPEASKKTIDDIAKILDEKLNKKRKSLTPVQLESYNSILKKNKVETKNFNGYYLDQIVNGYSRDYHLTDGKVYLYIRMVNTFPKGVINYENIESIISTMETTSYRLKK
jgi:hypothetical protein